MSLIGRAMRKRQVGRDFSDADLIARIVGWPTPMRQVFTSRNVYDYAPRIHQQSEGLNSHSREFNVCSSSAAARPNPW